MSREEETEGTGPEEPWGSLRGGASLEERTLLSRHISLLLVRKGDAGNLQTAPAAGAAAVVRDVEAGDRRTVSQPCWLWDKRESEVLGTKPRCLVPAVWRKELPSVDLEGWGRGRNLIRPDIFLPCESDCTSSSCELHFCLVVACFPISLLFLQMKKGKMQFFKKGKCIAEWRKIEVTGVGPSAGGVAWWASAGVPLG